MTELPEGLTAYKRTPSFSETTVPAGLLKNHATKAGVWGLIHVETGRLRYVVPSRDEDRVLDRANRGVVTPEVLHRVEPLGPVRFYVEFWR